MFSQVESPQEKTPLVDNRSNIPFPRDIANRLRKENFESLYRGKLLVTTLARYVSNRQSKEHGTV